MATPTKSREDPTLEDEVNEELDRRGQSFRWTWSFFLVSTLPTVVVGFNISSYIFVAQLPNDSWCEIHSLAAVNWTRSQMQTIANNPMATDSCHVYRYDYDYLSTMAFNDALEYTQQIPLPAEVPCLSDSSTRMVYIMDGDSITTEWNLVCENSVLRTLAQSIASIGMCVGALCVGILSDKYGRKKLFGCGTMLYSVAIGLIVFSPWYWSYLMGRALMGLSSMAVLCTSIVNLTENVAPKHRYWTGIAFNIGFPIGSVYSAMAANFYRNWRDLQTALAIPAVGLFLVCYLFTESPRWLLSKGRVETAYYVVFGRKYKSTAMENRGTSSATKTLLADGVKRSGAFKEIITLYSHSKQRRVAFICHFVYFAAAFSYFVTAINAVSESKVLFVLATGGVDVLAMVANIACFRNLGRRWACTISFAASGTCMLALLAIPAEQTFWVLSIALLGRIGVVAVYDIVTLYTAELFPTEIRSSAVGLSSMCGHVGSMLAPFVVDFTGRFAWYVPSTIIGCTMFVASVLIQFNPETQNQKLADHVKSEKKAELSA